ncbi:LysR family transcriptional regulator [Pantoea eucrina]|uniref:LysR family transcriptional regulator n=1 Tax=Pantoea eucrina TaxID=472693 RepID=UPI002FDA6ED2
MPDTLPIELLRTFHAVVRAGKFSAAAEHLYKSPAAVSTHIQRLEAVAGGRLLHRDNQSVSLTALGKRLLASTAELLRAHDRALAELQGTRLAGRLTLGVPDEYAARIIREILPVFSAAWPNVVLALKMGTSDMLKEEVARGKLDMAVVVQPHEAVIPDALLLMTTTPVWAGPVNADLTVCNPLPLAVYDTPCVYRKAMTTALEADGRDARIILESHSSQAVHACVEAGLAVSVIDRAKVTERMQILDGLPAIPDHHILLLRSDTANENEAVALLTRAIQQFFRL